ncbi:uncharacterized membrane protein HdeD (DUF308 family) [Bacillus tianshenii]|uniref:Uncharacterized membrane protein HdeD (DUF308 family) n=1 Tax=Sutcliffiella tianshenii TaxID=1463404 RepID=A0ABS2P2G0_9BACI|nr:DUF4181 domain-containing protein [Bacillus tianshenii]MBM7621123.1 uncharacterized membrane protein HdeD (DUF308 family) [Bacillus tianshenii]
MVGTKLLLFGAMFYCVKFLLKATLIKTFKVKKEPYHDEEGFVNKKHKSINIILGPIIIIILIFLFYLQHIENISQMLFLGICLLFIALFQVIEAFFWWKDDKESRYFVLCIGEAVLFIIFGIIIWQFGIFGLTAI